MSAPFSVSAARTQVTDYDFFVDGMYFSILPSYGNSLSLVGFDKETISQDVVIPSVVEGYEVIIITQSLFECLENEETTIRSVVIPDTITEISKAAFKNCKKLVSVTLPDTLTKIDKEAFFGCSALVTINIPEKATLEDSAFEGCSSLKSISIPTSMRTLDPYVFKDCTSLESVVIPKKIDIIQPGVFKGCKNLKTVEFENGCAVYCFSSSIFEDCTSLIEITIPSTVEEIDSKAFKNCVNLKTVTFANGSYLNTISEEAFMGCTSLESITFPDKLKKIGESAFSDCHYLSNVTLNESIEYIEPFAFLNTSLFDVTIPDDIYSLGYYSFGFLADEENLYRLLDFTVYGSVDTVAYEYAQVMELQFSLRAPIISSVKNTTDGVKISFKHILGVEGKYRIYKKTTGTSWNKVADVTGTSYTDKDVVSGTKYTYTVKYIGDPVHSAYDKNGKSIVHMTAPKVSKIENTADGAKITWSKVAGASSYVVYIIDSGQVKKYDTTTSTSYTHKKALNAKTYTYTVAACDSRGKNLSAYNKTGWSNKFVSAPKISSVSNTSTGPKITWGKVSGVSKYRVFVKSGSSWKKLKDTTSTSYTHTAAESGKTYTYTVRCLSSSGKSYLSGYYTAGTKNMFLSMPVVSKISNTQTGAKITFSKVAGASKYNIYVKSSSGWKKLGETAKTSYTHTSAKSNTTYSYRVRAYDSTGAYMSSYKSAGDSNKFIASPVIAYLTSTSKGVKIAWGKVDGAAKYRVFVKSGSKWKKLKDTTSTSFVDKSAKLGKKYTYTVRCLSSSGKSYTSGYNSKGETILYDR